MPAWTFEGRPPIGGLSGDAVTLVEGACFCISSANGDIGADAAHGLFFRDTRFLSMWQLAVNGSGLEPLAVEAVEPFAASFVSRARPVEGRADSTLLVVRRRFVGEGMREDLVVQNLSAEQSACTLTLDLAVDFAHVFDVKEGRGSRRPASSVHPSHESLEYSCSWPEGERGLTVRASEPLVVSPGRLLAQTAIPPRGEWTVSLYLELSADGFRATPPFSAAAPLHQSEPAVRLRDWRRQTPAISSDHDGLSALVATAVEDLGSLRIFDPDAPERVIVAAGSPWFMTLFGRDSLLTSWMTLLVDPSLAMGTLLALADLQGDKEDPITEEQPGRILHEVRWGAPLFEGLGDVYYGTVDATPLFVMLLAEAQRWGLDAVVIEHLLPHADRALEWVENYGDRDGDGFVEYQRLTDRGLLNQGWKDSFDGISDAAGRIVEPPLALCEVQGYVYAAYLGRAQLAEKANDGVTAEHSRMVAARLKEAFNEAFWLPGQGWFALGLDADKRPIDALASNMGHCLWTGIVDQDKAEQIGRHLSGPAMFSGWGVRTLASSMGAFNPMSYHNGSVWPHDTALVVAGLMRYGLVEEAQRIALGLVHAAESFGGRLPELFCGFDRSEFGTPVPYPTSCSPQAWAAASIFCVLRALLGFEPAMQNLELRIAPNVPQELGTLRVRNVPLAGERLSVEVSGGEAKLDGLPAGIKLIRGSQI
jgi:glycogen debranching enzyme